MEDFCPTGVKRRKICCDWMVKHTICGYIKYKSVVPGQRIFQCQIKLLFNSEESSAA